MTKIVKFMKFVFDRSDNIVEKGENANYHHFLFFPMFSSASQYRVVTSMCSKELNRKHKKADT